MEGEGNNVVTHTEDNGVNSGGEGRGGMFRLQESKARESRKKKKKKCGWKAES